MQGVTEGSKTPEADPVNIQKVLQLKHVLVLRLQLKGDVTLTGEDVGVSVLRPVDGQVSGIMGKIQTDALQILKKRKTN